MLLVKSVAVQGPPQPCRVSTQHMQLFIVCPALALRAPLSASSTTQPQHWEVACGTMQWTPPRTGMGQRLRPPDWEEAVLWAVGQE
jgi:hypothetical protein